MFALFSLPICDHLLFTTIHHFLCQLNLLLTLTFLLLLGFLFTTQIFLQTWIDNLETSLDTSWSTNLLTSNTSLLSHNIRHFFLLLFCLFVKSKEKYPRLRKRFFKKQTKCQQLTSLTS